MFRHPRTVLIVLVLLLTGAGMATPFASRADDTNNPAAIGQAAAVVGSAFTYQGRLEENGLPVTGSRDFRFTLHSDPVANAQIGPQLTQTGAITNGYFTALLDFGANAFDGNARWLLIEAKQGANPFVALTPRQALTPAPYALFALNGGGQSQFGAVWTGSGSAGLTITNLTGKGLIAAGPGGGVEGTTATDGSAGVTGSNTGTCLTAAPCYGVLGTANNVSGIGVRGEGFIAGVSGESFNTGVFGKSGFGIGVQGQSTSGSGVYGSTTSGSSSVAGVHGFSSGTGVGVLGTVGGTSGYGVLAKSPGVAGIGIRAEGGIVAVQAIGKGDGIVAESQSLTQGNGVDATGVGPGVSGAGVYGSNTSNVNCQALGPTSYYTHCFGVVGIGGGVAGVGVYGDGVNTGVWASGGPTGLFAQGTTWAGYFQGSVRVDGTLSATTVTQTSDAKLKKDVRGIQYGLAEVLALRPVSYGWRTGDDDRTHLGLLAQDVEAIIPGAVFAPDGVSPNYRLSYTDLIPVLIRAIQEQDAKIDALTPGGSPLVERTSAAVPDPRIDELTAEVAALRAASNHGSGPPWALLAALCVGVAGGGFGLFTAGMAMGRKRNFAM